MKKFIFGLLCTLQILLSVSKAQNIAINTDGSVPDASSMLDITSTTKGFLTPRMTTTQQNAITLPANGLLIYNTTDNTFKVNTGTSGAPVWTTLSTTSSSWLLTGNSGTNTSTNFLGTTDNVNLNFRTNNLQRMVIDTSGRFAVGTTTFNATNPEKMLIDAGTTTSVNAIVGKGSINNYLQLNIQNNSAGANASSDVVATANNGSETTNYVNMGINGGSNTSNIMGGANDSYLYNLGNNLLVGTGSASKSLVFMTGGTTQSSNERMRIDGTGNVGIGTTSPNSTFSVTGSQSVSFRSVTGAYTVLSTDYVVINTGGGTPTWTLPVATTCPGRVYYLINHGSNTVTLSEAITTASATTSTTLVKTAGTNVYQIISDGTVWRKMN